MLTKAYSHSKMPQQDATAQTKIATESTVHAIGNVTTDLEKIDTLVQKTIEGMKETTATAEQAKVAAKEAVDISKTTLNMVREMTLANQQHQAKIAQTYDINT